MKAYTVSVCWTVESVKHSSVVMVAHSTDEAEGRCVREVEEQKPDARRIHAAAREIGMEKAREIAEIYGII